MKSGTDIPNVAPNETWRALESNPTAVLIDVRTEAEWNQVGIPNLDGTDANMHLISWQFAPDMRPNLSFIDEMAAAGVAMDTPLYFLCRSGVRSAAAAKLAANAGYGPCYNISEGFEGVATPDGNRLGGWQGSGLPVTKPSASRE